MEIKGLGVMRRDTLGCWFYVISPSDSGPCKLGYSRNPQRRLADLQVCNHMELKLYSVWGSDHLSPLQIERRAHKLLASKWLRGEWFDISPTDASLVIQTIDSKVQSNHAVALLAGAAAVHSPHRTH